MAHIARQRPFVKTIVESDYEMDDRDDIINVVTGDKDRTIKLFKADIVYAGRRFWIRKVDDGNGSVVIDTPSQVYANHKISTQGDLVGLESDGSDAYWGC